MEARENECQISQNYILHMKFLKFYLYIIPILVKFDIHFLRLPWEIFFSVTADDLITSLALEKCKKECNIL